MNVARRNLAVGALGGLAVGVWLGAKLGNHARGAWEQDRWRRARQAWDRERMELVDQNIELRVALEDADAAIAELHQAIPKLWDRGFQAGRDALSFDLSHAQVERQQRSRARWN